MLRPREIYPLLCLYILYEMYIATISSFAVITYAYPLGILVLTPLSYCVFAWAGQSPIGADDVVDLEGAWKNMGLGDQMDVSREEMECIKPAEYTAKAKGKLMLSSTGGMSSLSELYVSRITENDNKARKFAKMETPKSGYTSEDGSPLSDYDDETFTFLPKSSQTVLEHVTSKSYLSESLDTITLWISKPWEVLFGFVLPYNKYPGIAFFMIIAFCFAISDLQLEMADGIIAYLGFNSNFIALTFYNLFSNMPDLLTVYTAAKNKEFTLALATIFSSQVLNLQVSLMLPWLLRCILWGGYSSSNSSMQNISMMSAVGILAVIAILLPLNKYRLNTLFGVLLLLMYAAYVFIVHKFV